MALAEKNIQMFITFNMDMVPDGMRIHLCSPTYITNIYSLNSMNTLLTHTYIEAYNEFSDYINAIS